MLVRISSSQWHGKVGGHRAVFNGTQVQDTVLKDFLFPLPFNQMATYF